MLYKWEVSKHVAGREDVERRVGDEVKPLDAVDARAERPLLFRVGGSQFLFWEVATLMFVCSLSNL